MAQPFFRDLSGGNTPQLGIASHDRDEASRVATIEQMAIDRAMGRPNVAPPERPVIKAPILPQDFEASTERIDKQILDRGVAIDRNKLVSLGRERFAELLAAERKARSWQRGIGDFASFESVQRGLHAFEASQIPRRKTSEQISGAGKDREAVRAIRDWSDLWKLTSERREILDDVYNFHDLFESLMFGHALLEKCSPDGRVRSRFFCGRKYVEFFTDWLSALQGPVVSVALVNPLFIRRHAERWDHRSTIPSGRAASRRTR
jgi:hypothetical protein